MRTFIVLTGRTLAADGSRLGFFEGHFPLWDMKWCGGIIDRVDHYRFDRKASGALKRGSVERISTSNMKRLGKAPVKGARDWVVLLKRHD